MLSELVVEDLGPIARAELVLRAGSSALTGETGAGKTLLVTAVTLLAGGRADRGIVRDGASEARVEGRFVVPASHPAVAVLESRDLLDAPDDEIEIVITRTISENGSRARVNGRLVPAAALSDLGAALVEIAGQHEHHRLSSPRAQRELLDRFAGSDTLDLAKEVADTVRELVRLERELAELEASERERARELDVLRFEMEELEGSAVRVGETAELTAEASRLENAELLGSALDEATSELVGETGADDSVQRAIAALRRAAEADPTMAPVIDRLENVSAELRDVGTELSRGIQEPDPTALEAIRDRLGELARLRRKYGDDEAEVVAYLERARVRSEDLTGKSEGIQTIGESIERLRAHATEKANGLSDARRDAATKLKKAVVDSLGRLAMAGSDFVVDVEATDLYEGGLDAVTFRVATGPGEKPRPLSKVASGGELSRIALALHLLARGSEAPTMIFDEVDAGVGGAAARSVGEALASLGSDETQVLVVTHLPQVAAFADSHYRVVRRDGERRDVVVEDVEGSDRVEELSRMLAGLSESDTAREHAQELLDLAARGRS